MKGFLVLNSFQDEGDYCSSSISSTSPASQAAWLATLFDTMKAGEGPSDFEGDAAMIMGLVAKPEHNGKCASILKTISLIDKCTSTHCGTTLGAKTTNDTYGLWCQADVAKYGDCVVLAV